MQKLYSTLLKYKSMFLPIILSVFTSGVALPALNATVAMITVTKSKLLDFIVVVFMISVFCIIDLFS